MDEQKQIFKEFLEEAISSEVKCRYGPAVSNYYKALTTLCSYLIINKVRKTPNNHNEVFLFLRVSFPEIYKIVGAVFMTYTSSYDHIMKKEDCEKIKNAIKEVVNISGIEKEFEESLKQI